MSVKAKLDWSLSVSGQLHGSLVITKLKSQIRGVPVFFLTSFHRLALTSADSPPPRRLYLFCEVDLFQKSFKLQTFLLFHF